jgi:metal-responsive CopG/Arc/MetJ family transcriptional regulator
MSTTLNIRIKEETLEQTDRLKKKFGAPSRSDVIRRAIGLSDARASAVENGDKIIIEGHGMRREIIMPGLNNGK